MQRAGIYVPPEGWPLWPAFEAQTFLKLLSLGRLSVEGYVADVRSPAACGEVYSRLAKGGAFPITQFDWSWL